MVEQDPRDCVWGAAIGIEAEDFRTDNFHVVDARAYKIGPYQYEAGIISESAAHAITLAGETLGFSILSCVDPRKLGVQLSLMQSCKTSDSFELTIGNERIHIRSRVKVCKATRERALFEPQIEYPCPPLASSPLEIVVPNTKIEGGQAVTGSHPGFIFPGQLNPRTLVRSGYKVNSALKAYEIYSAEVHEYEQGDLIVPVTVHTMFTLPRF